MLDVTSLVAQTVKRLPAMRETRIWFLGQEDALEKEMAIHSNTLAWKIPWTEDPDRLQSMGSQRVGHDWATSLSLSLYAKHQNQPPAKVKAEDTGKFPGCPAVRIRPITANGPSGRTKIPQATGANANLRPPHRKKSREDNLEKAEEIKWQAGAYIGIWVLENALEMKSCQQDPVSLLETPKPFINIILVYEFDEKSWRGEVGREMGLKISRFHTDRKKAQFKS